MPAGRPAHFETPDELQEKINEYLVGYGDRSAPTISGLALFLGFESRQSFYDYEQREEFSYTIKRARLHLEVYYEEKLMTVNAGGAIFALKNFGWADKQEVDHTTKGEAMAPTINVYNSSPPLNSNEKDVNV